jgi:hypothetical protein
MDALVSCDGTKGNGGALEVEWRNFFEWRCLLCANLKRAIFRGIGASKCIPPLSIYRSEERTQICFVRMTILFMTACA